MLRCVRRSALSITDPVILQFDERYEHPWHLTRGRETFYNEERWQRRWATAQEAIDWSRKELDSEPRDGDESISTRRTGSISDPTIRGSEGETLQGKGGQISFLPD